MGVKRFEVFVVSLDSTAGREIRKSRPCVIISPDELNAWVSTVIVAPMTTKGRPYPSRVPYTFKGKQGQIVLDQIRTVDKARLVKRLRKIDARTASQALAVVSEMFAI